MLVESLRCPTSTNLDLALVGTTTRVRPGWCRVQLSLLELWARWRRLDGTNRGIG